PRGQYPRIQPQGPGRRADRRLPSRRRRPLTPAPESAHRRRILVWLCVLVAVNQLGFGGVVAVLALSARSFGVGQSAIGLSIAVYGLARFLLAVPAGQLADRV